MYQNKYLPYILLALALGTWILFFPWFREDFLSQFYYMPVLGVVAATVANTTPAAAGIVYFPILTRLSIDPSTAVQFSLIIQAYGMGLGTLRWSFVNKRLFIANVLPTSLLGGILGIITSIVFFPISNPEMLTLVFNFTAFVFTQIIFFSIIFKRRYPNLTVDLTWGTRTVLLFFSFMGGLVSGWIGFGIDTMFYFILTIVFRINPAAAIVTSISLMAAVSFVGTLLNTLVGTIPFSLWYSAVPGVTVAGLFLAAYLAMKIGPKNVLMLFTVFLSIDFFMTLWTQHTIPMSQAVKNTITYVLVVYLLVIHVKIFKQGYDDINGGLGEFRPEKGRF